MRYVLGTALASALLFSASAASAVVIFETGADGPANQNVDWIEEAAGNGDKLIEGFINGTLVGVRAESEEDLKTTGNGVVWITGNDNTLHTLTYSLVGYKFTAFEVDLKDPTGNNPNWSVTFETDDGSTQTYSPFINGGFVSAYTEDGSLITSVTFETTANIAGTGQTRFGGLVADSVVPEPATWALMIAGFGGAGAMLRRRRLAVA